MTRDPDYSPFAPHRPMAPPQLELLETCWRLKAPSRRILTCAVFRDAAPGLEVRVGFSDDDLLRSQRTAEIGTAREIAAEWKAAVIAKGGFTGIRTENLS